MSVSAYLANLEKPVSQCTVIHILQNIFLVIWKIPEYFHIPVHMHSIAISKFWKVYCKQINTFKIIK